MVYALIMVGLAFETAKFCAKIYLFIYSLILSDYEYKLWTDFSSSSSTAAAEVFE